MPDLPKDRSSLTNPHPASSLAEPAKPRILQPGEAPSRELVAFGSAQAGYDLATNGVNGMTQNILNITLGINPAWIGTILMIRGIWDAFTDPIMGHISDHTRSRWGRRRPYIFVGSILLGIVTVALWLFNRDWSDQAILWYFGTMLVLYATCTTVFGVAYGALSIEMSPSYHGRTRVQVYKAVFSKIVGFSSPWFFTITLLPVFGDALNGMRWLAVACALAMVTTGVACAVVSKERTKAKIHKENILHSVWGTIRNRDFIRVTFIYMTLIFLLGIFGVYGNYLAIYYVCQGDKIIGASLAGGAGSLGAFMGLLAVPFAGWLARRYQKHNALIVCITAMAFGSAMQWWCMNPHHPWMMYLPAPFYSLGIASLFVILGSLFADVVDSDELRSGFRREGMFGAASGYFMKLASAGAAGVSGWLLNSTGFDVALGGNQTELTFTLLRAFFAFGPVVMLTLCIYLLWDYPLTELRIAEIQTELARRKAAAET